ncbi:MAG: protoporphyrinogen oxidase [Burkholderiales bacterium]|nr:protoporphyrinogen oxidase [Burkholderiales bacterium]
MIDAAVIGGGISGLAAAHELRRWGYEVCVLERQQRAGGNAISERIDGFLMEHGPSSMSGADGAVAELTRVLGIDGQRCDLGANVRYRYLTRSDHLHRIRTQPFAFLLSNYLSWRARVRLAAEWLVPARSDTADESVAHFCRRRFGAEFAAAVVDPLLGGLRAARAEETSMSACFPALAAMERKHGSVIGALYANRAAGRTMPGRRLYSWRDGVANLPRALAASLDSLVRTGVAVRRIRPRGRGYSIDAGGGASILARAVILATQPHVAATLLQDIDTDTADAAAAIDAPPMAVVFLGYRRHQVEHPLDGLGYLTAEREGRAVSGTLFNSTMFPGRAPSGCIALTAYLGGARSPSLARLPERDLIALAREEFHELLGARGAPVVAKIRQWARSLPQYRLGHESKLAILQAAGARNPGVFITGNYFRGPSMTNCIEQARATALRAAAFLRDSTARGATSGCGPRGLDASPRPADLAAEG